MKPAFEVSSLFAMGTTIGSGGTVTATNQAIEWSPSYEPEGKLVVCVGATPTGTVIARMLGGTAAADTATTIAVGTVTGGLAGTIVFDVQGAVTTRYVSAQVISTGGTALVGASFQ